MKIQAHPSDNLRAFRSCLGQFATGVAVMLARHEGANAGVTANSYSSLSLDPPLVLWSIAKTSRSFETFKQADHFSINFLSSQQMDVSQRFAGSAADKFEGWDPEYGMFGSPIVPDALATLECSRDAVHDGGDHVIIVGRVERYTQREAAPLLFSQGKYSVAEQHPDIALVEAPTPEAKLDPSFSMLSTLLLKAYHAHSEGFERCRQRVGLNVYENRMLFILEEAGGANTEEATRLSYLSTSAAEEAISSLASRGLIKGTAGEGWTLTEQGKLKREDVRRESVAYENRLLEGHPPKDILAFREFLQSFVKRSLTIAHDEGAGPPIVE